LSSDPLLVGIDIGTTNLKVCVFDVRGQLIAQASAPTPTHRPRVEWAHYDPAQIWLVIAGLLRQVTAVVEAVRIVSIAVASFSEAGVPLDSHGEPLHPVIAWFDQRAVAQTHAIEAQIGKDAIFATTGLSLQPIFTLPKLLWLKQHEPEVYRKTARWLNMADYIAYKLCGVAATDYSLASRMMAMDLAGRHWANDLLSAVGLSSAIFAPLCNSGVALGVVTSEAASATGLPTSAQVACGGHDHLCGALAIGVTEPGVVLDSMGTVEAICAVLDRPLTDLALGQQGYTQGAHVVPDRYYILGAAYTSGGSIEWFRDTFAPGVSYASLIAEASQVPPGSRGVCFLPHLKLASPPFDDPGGRGALIGLGTEADRGTLFRAVLEGLAYDSHLMIEALAAFDGLDTSRALYAIGGGTRNPLLLAIKASVMNRPLIVASVEEATCLGAALLGGLGAGVYPTIDSALAQTRQPTTEVEPDPAAVACYADIFQQVYRQFYATLRPLHQHLRRYRADSA